MTHLRFAAGLQLIAAISLIGCGESSDVDDGVTAEFSDFDALQAPTEEQTAAGDGMPNGQTQSGQIGLRLQPGDRFPLIKTIQQSLMANTEENAGSSRSLLELVLTLQCEQVVADRVLMSVRYHRVRYQHDIAGTHIAYDSDNPGQSIPRELLPYQGLVNNGFSFWLGRNNQILEVASFDAFVERCLRNVAPEDQERIKFQIQTSLGAEGVASFIDDSIGLLPYGDETRAGIVQVGDRWQRSRTMTHPQPLMLNATCTLTSINENIAEIDIIEQISGADIPLPPDQTAIARVDVRGGHAIGRCTIDRRSGLPIHSEMERYLDLLVQTSDGTPVIQKKRVVTTVAVFPAQSQTGQPVALGGPAMHPSARPAQQQAAVPPQLQPAAIHQTGGITLDGQQGIVPASNTARPAAYDINQ